VVDASSGAVGVNPVQTLCQSWLALSAWGRGYVVISVLLGLALPVMGVSLALFVLFDWLRWRAATMCRSPNHPLNNPMAC
jgi:hypothetical protein